VLDEQRILLAGGTGRLGRELAPRFREEGFDVAALGRRVLDAAVWHDALGAVVRYKPDLVVNLAAETRVGWCEDNYSTAWRSNALTAGMLAVACRQQGVPFVQVSTDYVLGSYGPHAAYPLTLGGQLLGPTTVYGKTKALGELLALEAEGTVVRVAHLCPDDAKEYSWLNGVTVSSRDWTHDCAERLARFVVEENLVGMPLGSCVCHVGPPETRTVADMVRERWPAHPALADVVTDPGELRERLGYPVPLDTRFDPHSLWK